MLIYIVGNVEINNRLKLAHNNAVKKIG